MSNTPCLPHVAFSLRSLAERYANACDERDADAFTAVFTTNGRLRVFNLAISATPLAEFLGARDLARIPVSLNRYHRTVHVVANASYRQTGPTVATGVVHGIAHHLRHADAVDEVMYITYHDEYDLVDDVWLLRERAVNVEWSESHITDSSWRAHNPVRE